MMQSIHQLVYFGFRTIMLKVGNAGETQFSKIISVYDRQEGQEVFPERPLHCG